MERTFGEKSYHPGKFDFLTIFSGEFNSEYKNLFSRKLPGQILLSAYHTPVTVQELCMELGIAAVYMEDELALLAKYHLISELPNRKYQTNLVIFTEDYIKAFFRELDAYVPQRLAAILQNVKRKLPDIREIGFSGYSLEENKLLWDLYVMVIYHALAAIDTQPYMTELYPGAVGVNYGCAYDKSSLGENESWMFAGYIGLGELGNATYINFRALKDDGSWMNPSEICNAVKGTPNDKIPSFTVAQKEKILDFLSEEADQMKNLLREIMRSDESVLSELVPNSVKALLPEIVSKTYFFETAGYLGSAALRSGELYVPQEIKNTAIFVTLSEVNDSWKNARMV